MQTKTHLALGHYLLDREAAAVLHRYRGLFLPGCIEPDYNLVTYLRGLRGHGLFHGHNAANSSAYISASLRSFEKDGVGIPRWISPGFSSASTERTAHATAAASAWVWPSPSG